MRSVTVPGAPALVSRSVAPRLQFLLLTLAIYVVQLVSGNAPVGGVSHWLVPDGQTYHDVVDALTIDGVGALVRILPEQFSGVPVNPLLFLYYYPFYLLLGVFGYFFANNLLVHAVGGRFIFVGILLTPYFLLSFALPSKDLMVLVLFIPFLRLVLERKYLSALLVAAAIFWVRDGAGIVALGCLIATWLAPRKPRYRLYMVGVGLAVIAILNQFVYEYFGEAFIVVRNLQIAQDEGNFDLGGEGASTYLIRFIGNATNLAFRPVFLDIGGNFSAVAIAYWFSGLSQVVCLIYAVRFLWNRSSDEVASNLAMFFLVSLMIISLNPLVQPRYQLFFVVIMLEHLLATQSLIGIIKAYVASSLVAVAATTAYVWSGIGLPEEYGWAQLMNLI